MHAFISTGIQEGTEGDRNPLRQMCFEIFPHILFHIAKPIHRYWWQKSGQICVTADFKKMARFITGFVMRMIKLFRRVTRVITAAWAHQSREEKSKARWWNSFVLSSSVTYYYSLWEFALIHVLNSHLSPTKKSTRSSWNVNDDGNKWIAKTVLALL